MKSIVELMAMSHEELAELAKELQIKCITAEYDSKKVKRLTEILSAVGIAYETYKRES